MPIATFPNWHNEDPAQVLDAEFADGRYFVHERPEHELSERREFQTPESERGEFPEWRHGEAERGEFPERELPEHRRGEFPEFEGGRESQKQEFLHSELPERHGGEFPEFEGGRESQKQEFLGHELPERRDGEFPEFNSPSPEPIGFPDRSAPDAESADIREFMSPESAPQSEMWERRGLFDDVHPSADAITTAQTFWLE